MTLSKIVKLALLAVIGSSLLLAMIQPYTPKTLFRNQIAVIMYHHIDDTATSSSTVTSSLFREQLRYLLDKGYHFLTLEEFKRYMEGTAIPDNAALVTFDDGYESFYTYAFPVLQELQIPAVNFLITETLDHPRNGYIPFLTREQVRLMSQTAANIDFQCHTHALHAKNEHNEALLISRNLVEGKEETQAAYEQRIIQDTRSCIANVQQSSPGIVHSIDSFAYPFGIFDESSARLLTEGGMHYAFTIVPKMTTRKTDPMKIPRINAGSPNISPEDLHHKIMRRIMLVGK